MAGQTILWDAADTAKLFKVSRQTIYRKAASGELPCIKVFGTLLRFDPEVMRKIAAGEQQGRAA